MRATKAARRLFPIALLIGILGVGAFVFLPRDKLLLDRAIRVADTTGWGGGKRFNVSVGIHWLRDEEVMFDRFEGPSHDQRIIYKRNIRTGQEARLDALTNIREGFDVESC